MPRKTAAATAPAAEEKTTRTRKPLTQAAMDYARAQAATAALAARIARLKQEIVEAEAHLVTAKSTAAEALKRLQEPHS